HEHQLRWGYAIVMLGFSMLDKGVQLITVTLQARLALERFNISEKCDDDIRLMAGQPFVRRFPMPLGVGIVGELRMKALCAREGPRGRTAGMRAETRRIASIAHIAYIQVVRRIAHVQFGLKMTVLHHSRS